MMEYEYYEYICFSTRIILDTKEKNEKIISQHSLLNSRLMDFNDTQIRVQHIFNRDMYLNLKLPNPMYEPMNLASRLRSLFFFRMYL